jgi:hypothetical protein
VWWRRRSCACSFLLFVLNVATQKTGTSVTQAKHDYHAEHEEVNFSQH